MTMPVFSIKAKDALAVETIEFYRDLCTKHRLYGQAYQVQLALNEVVLWQQDHEAELKLPDHVHVPVTP